MNKKISINNKLAIFKGKEIRKTIHNDEWWFAIADIVEILTDSIDVKQYIKKMRARDKNLIPTGVQIVPLLD